eukprot:397210-Pyramimonas_sp.AAC.1
MLIPGRPDLGEVAMTGRSGMSFQLLVALVSRVRPYKRLRLRQKQQQEQEGRGGEGKGGGLSLIHISEPTRPEPI